MHFFIYLENMILYINCEIVGRSFLSFFHWLKIKKSFFRRMSYELISLRYENTTHDEDSQIFYTTVIEIVYLNK